MPIQAIEGTRFVMVMKQLSMKVGLKEIRKLWGPFANNMLTEVDSKWDKSIYC